MAPSAIFNPLTEEGLGHCTYCKNLGRVQPCFKCRKVHYCSKDCRLNDLSRHKKQCKRADHERPSASNRTTNIDTAQDPNAHHESNRHPPPGLPAPNPHSPHPPFPTSHHSTRPTPNRLPDTSLTQPFHALHYRTWLHGRDLETTALLLHDTFRHRRHLCTIHEDSVDQFDLRKDPDIALKNWIKFAVKEKLLSRSQLDSSSVYLPKLISEAQAWARKVKERGGDGGIPAAPGDNNTNDKALLPIVWDDTFMAERHDDERMGLQMCMFGEQVMGRAVNKPQDQSQRMVLRDEVLLNDLLKWEIWKEKGAPPGFDWRTIFGHL